VVVPAAHVALKGVHERLSGRARQRPAGVPRAAA
jgi:hypothetical protein